MQPVSGGGGGLTRFNSTPASWLESFILKEEDEVDERQQDHNLSFTQLLSNNNVAAGPGPSTPESHPYLSDYYSSPLTPTSATVANNPFTQVFFYFIYLIILIDLISPFLYLYLQNTF